MKAFLSIKFWGDDRNKTHVEAVISAIKNTGFDVVCFRKDAEEWGKIQYTPQQMMQKTFDEIDKSDVLIADVGDWPIGVGVETGYAYAKGIPVICICPANKPTANTVSGLAKITIKYQDYEELTNQLKALNSLK